MRVLAGAMLTKIGTKFASWLARSFKKFFGGRNERIVMTAIKMEEALFRAQEAFSWRLFFSLSLGSLFLMGCDERLASDEPEDLGNPVVQTRYNPQAVEDVKYERAATRDHETNLADKSHAAAANLAKIQGDSATEQESLRSRARVDEAVIRGNAQVASEAAKGKAQNQAAMTGGLFGLGGELTKGMFAGQIADKRAEADLRSAEIRAAADLKNAETQARNLELQFQIALLNLERSDPQRRLSVNYLCGGDGQGIPNDPICGTIVTSWRSKVEKAAQKFTEDLRNEELAANFLDSLPGSSNVNTAEKRKKYRTEAVENFRNALIDASKEVSFNGNNKPAHENTTAALAKFVEDALAQNGSEKPTFHGIIEAHMNAHNEALRRTTTNTATRDYVPGVQDNVHAYLRTAGGAADASPNKNTEDFR